MIFESGQFLDIVFNGLFESYQKNVPDVQKITNAMVTRGIINSQRDIVNDHVAFRTLGVPNLGIQSLEKIFLQHGYEKRDYYYFQQKKVAAYWYSPPHHKYPRVFLSELCVEELSPKVVEIIRKYTKPIEEDPLLKIDLNDPHQVTDFLHASLWQLPSLKDYMDLQAESEYAAWVIYNRYYLNHYTISVHTLKGEFSALKVFNDFLIDIGIKLNDSGGVIKKSQDNLLHQSSTIAHKIMARFSDGQEMMIPTSYVEFAERRALPAFKHLANILRKHRRDGFEVGNADKIFESTYQSQVQRS